MAIEVWDFDVSIPAGTAKASPQTTALAMPAGRVVERLDWRVPPGPRGTVGWALAAAGTVFIPRGSGGYIVTDSESDSWVLEDQLEAAAWTVLAYNTGSYQHTLYFTFHLALAGSGLTGASQPLDLSLLSG